MSNRTVLIIEDNEDIQEIYKIHFESQGFTVISTLNGLDGIIKTLEISPDIILLDIMMPQMDGFEVLETIKNHSSINTPIIVCSNLSQESDKHKTFELGAHLFLVKSDYTGAQVVQKVISFLEKNKSS
ncbi:response regulator [Candidatus Gracilibacteria bacterium]|nr:response regulator [Candidatus Gracilibacteria bacterium]